MNYPFDAGAQVLASAREWHKLQLGALGFVGLCGVLRGDSGSGRPLWLQDLSGVAALAGLVLALVAVTLVATVAFPLVAVPSKPAAAARRLRLGRSLPGRAGGHGDLGLHGLLDVLELAHLVGGQRLPAPPEADEFDALLR